MTGGWTANLSRSDSGFLPLSYHCMQTVHDRDRSWSHRSSIIVRYLFDVRAVRFHSTIVFYEILTPVHSMCNVLCCEYGFLGANTGLGFDPRLHPSLSSFFDSPGDREWCRECRSYTVWLHSSASRASGFETEGFGFEPRYVQVFAVSVATFYLFVVWHLPFGAFDHVFPGGPPSTTGGLRGASPMTQCYVWLGWVNLMHEHG